MGWVSKPPATADTEFPVLHRSHGPSRVAPSEHLHLAPCGIPRDPNGGQLYVAINGAHHWR
jgi:hypothetical protein